MGGKSKLSTYQEQVSHTQRVGRTRPGEKFYVGGREGHAPHPLYLKSSFMHLSVLHLHHVHLRWMWNETKAG